MRTAITIHGITLHFASADDALTFVDDCRTLPGVSNLTTEAIFTLQTATKWEQNTRQATPDRSTADPPSPAPSSPSPPASIGGG